MNCLILFLRVSKNNFAYKNVKEIKPLFFGIVDNFPSSVDNLQIIKISSHFFPKDYYFCAFGFVP